MMLQAPSALSMSLARRICRGKCRQGFTLIELLVSITVLAVLMILVVQVLATVQRSFKQVSSKVSQFREARQAFNRIVFALQQATLNNYMIQIYEGTADPLVPPAKSLTSPPLGYARYSELQFLCGKSAGTTNGVTLTGLSDAQSPGHAVFFQAPLGTSSTYRLPMGLNGCGFFINYGDDSTTRPDFLNSRNHPLTQRYRLWEFRTPVENNSIYNYSPSSTLPRQNQSEWYQAPLTKSRPVADNIVLLIFSPRLAEQDALDGGAAGAKATRIAPNFFYNSVPSAPLRIPQQEWEHQLPPIVEVTMVAIDSATAERLAYSGDATVPTLQEYFDESSFSKAEDLVTDLRSLEDKLNAAKINYRIFSTSVSIRASKWGGGA